MIGVECLQSLGGRERRTGARMARDAAGPSSGGGGEMGGGCAWVERCCKESLRYEIVERLLEVVVLTRSWVVFNLRISQPRLGEGDCDVYA